MIQKRSSFKGDKIKFYVLYHQQNVLKTNLGNEYTSTCKEHFEEIF